AGSWSEGRDFAVEALVLARRVGSRLHEGLSHSLLCIVDRALCRWHSAIEHGTHSIRLYELLGARLQAAFVKRHMAVALWKRGDLARSAELIAETMPLLIETKHARHVCYAQLLRSLIALHLGNPTEAGALLVDEFQGNRLKSESRPELL